MVPEQTVVTIELGGRPYVVHQGRVAGTGLQAATRAALHWFAICTPTASTR